MHFSFVSKLMIFGKSDHLTLPQRQQRRPKLGEYFKHLFLVQKMSFFHIFFIFLVRFSNCNWLQSISEPQKPPYRHLRHKNRPKNTKVTDIQPLKKDFGARVSQPNLFVAKQIAIREDQNPFSRVGYQ